jgi:hypothetical protein
MAAGDSPLLEHHRFSASELRVLSFSPPGELAHSDHVTDSEHIG